MGRSATAAKIKPSISDGLAAVEEYTQAYSERRADLVQLVHELDKEVSAIRARRLKAIKKAAAEAKEAREELSEVLDQWKAEFERPRTRVFHGIRVGFRKLVGSLTWDDTASVVKLIKRHFPDQVGVLIKTTESPIVGAIEQLPAVDLKRLGCTIEEDTDVVVIKAEGGDIEKLVDALLKGTDESEG